jgi:hypothetical protein
MSYFLFEKGSRPYAKIWKKCNEKWPKHSSKTPIITDLQAKMPLKRPQKCLRIRQKKTPITLILRNLSKIYPKILGNSVSMNIPGCKYKTCNPTEAAPNILGSLSSMNKVSAAINPSWSKIY